AVDAPREGAGPAPGPLRLRRGARRDLRRAVVPRSGGRAVLLRHGRVAGRRRDRPALAGTVGEAGRVSGQDPRPGPGGALGLRLRPRSRRPLLPPGPGVSPWAGASP